jgi:hypothetical protein
MQAGWRSRRAPAENDFTASGLSFERSLHRRSHVMIEMLSAPSDNVLAVKISGKLHDADYKTFVPAVDAAIANDGKVRILVQFHDFHGWDAKALWDDIKFATTHCTKIEKIAMVGEKTWEKWMAKVCKPFTMAKVKYFDASQMDDARAWLQQEG